MKDTRFNCLPTIIGSMPGKDAKAACALVARYLKDLPAWPQLPQRSFLENMYVQYSEGFPNIVIEGDRVYVDAGADYQHPLELLYTAYLAEDADKFPISPDYAAGLYEFLALDGLNPLAVKGHVTGPLSWGMTVTDQNKRSILYDDILGDAVPKLLRLKAAWQERQLMKLCKDTITFVDEPYMASFGSSVAAGPFSSPGKVAEMIDEVFAGIQGLKGIHCCGNTDWSVLLSTKLDILNFDAYSYAESISLYPKEIKQFLARGGVIAWGIVPNQVTEVGSETVASLKDRLEEAIAPFTRHGIPFKEMLSQSLLTPACGLTHLDMDGVAAVLEQLTGLSARMREKYF